MEAPRIIVATLGFAVAAAGAAGETLFIRPGPCAAQETYLLAGNSGAIIRVEAAKADDEGERVIVYRRQPRQGWASQRVLKRFDLKLDELGTTIVNSGQFCRGLQ